jgi:hypothetical protein
MSEFHILHEMLLELIELHLEGALKFLLPKLELHQFLIHLLVSLLLTLQSPDQVGNLLPAAIQLPLDTIHMGLNAMDHAAGLAQPLIELGLEVGLVVTDCA